MEARQTLEINLGRINDPIYGDSTTDLKFFVPLMSSFGSPESLDLVIGSDDIESLVQEFLPDARSLWEEDLDEVILQKLETYIILSAYVCPQMAADPSQRKSFNLFIKFFLMTFVMEDIMIEQAQTGNELLTKEFKDIDMDGKEMKLIRELGRVVGNWNGTGDPEDIDAPAMTPGIKSIIPHAARFVRDLKVTVPDFKIKSKAFKKEVEKSCTSLASSSTALDIANDATAWTCISVTTLEVFALLEEISVPEVVRKDPLFKGFLDSYKLAAGTINSLLGVKENVKADRGAFSAALKLVLNGMNIREAFESYGNLALDRLKKFNGSLDDLRKKYPKDGDLEKYLKASEGMLNGQVLWRRHRTR